MDKEKYDLFRDKCHLPYVRIEDNVLYAKPLKVEYNTGRKDYLVYLFFKRHISKNQHDIQNGNITSYEITKDYSNQFVIVPKKGFCACIRIPAMSSIENKVVGKPGNRSKVLTAIDNMDIEYIINLEEFTYNKTPYFNPQTEEDEEIFELFLDKTSDKFSIENSNFEALYYNLDKNFFSEVIPRIINNN
jgi:hypothetical protein